MSSANITTDLPVTAPPPGVNTLSGHQPLRNPDAGGNENKNGSFRQSLRNARVLSDNPKTPPAHGGKTSVAEAMKGQSTPLTETCGSPARVAADSNPPQKTRATQKKTASHGHSEPLPQPASPAPVPMLANPALIAGIPALTAADQAAHPNVVSTPTPTTGKTGSRPAQTPTAAPVEPSTDVLPLKHQKSGVDVELPTAGNVDASTAAAHHALRSGSLPPRGTPTPVADGPSPVQVEAVIAPEYGGRPASSAAASAKPAFAYGDPAGSHKSIHAKAASHDLPRPSEQKSFPAREAPVRHAHGDSVKNNHTGSLAGGSLAGGSLAGGSVVGGSVVGGGDLMDGGPLSVSTLTPMTGSAGAPVGTPSPMASGGNPSPVVRLTDPGWETALAGQVSRATPGQAFSITVHPQIMGPIQVLATRARNGVLRIHLAAHHADTVALLQQGAPVIAAQIMGNTQTGGAQNVTVTAALAQGAPAQSFSTQQGPQNQTPQGDGRRDFPGQPRSVSTVDMGAVSGDQNGSTSTLQRTGFESWV